MREFKVFLKGADEPVVIKAEDVNMVSADGPSVGVFLNFWMSDEKDGHDLTVAAVPLEEVRYVVSA